MRCSQCDGEDCIHIEIRLSGTDSVEFYSCRMCETKWWEHQGDTIALDEVLTLAGEGDLR
jgi:hypothetical protein